MKHIINEGTKIHMKKVLISGFDAFGGDVQNASEEIVKRLPQQIGTLKICACVLPTEAEASVQILKAKIKSWNPDYVVNLGLAKGRKAISIERIAINIDDFSIPDNAGKQYIDTKIEAHGADGYFSNLSIKALLKKMQEAGYPVYISNTAGTFVCNHVMYAMQFLAHTTYPHLKTGFIHVPDMDDTKENGLPLEEMVSAIQCLLSHLEEKEIAVESGTLW